MRARTPITLVFIFAVCTGCTTVRQFRGVAANLEGNGDETRPETPLKIGVTCSGTSRNGDRYVAFSFGRKNCWLVLFHPPVDPTKSFCAETDSHHTSAWLVRGSKPDCTALARRGADAAFCAKAERLRGWVEITFRSGRADFYANNFELTVELVGEARETEVRGEFEAYSAVWKPLILPALLLGL